MKRARGLVGTLAMMAMIALMTLSLAATAQGVGFVRLATVGDAPVPVAVWYPSTAATVPWEAGPYTVRDTRDAPLAPGLHPLVLLSHGSGGGEYNHADLAEALAQRGYVVAAPRHVGDSFDSPQGRGSDVQLTGRPWQAVAALDAVLADARLAPAIDAERIGMAGFSAGGYTTLVLAGAKPDLQLHGAHCHAHPDDAELCPDGADARFVVTRAGWALPPRDSRVRAAVLMAPLSVMFDARGLADVTLPLRIYKAQDDRMLQNRFNTDPLAAALPGQPERVDVPGGHFVFLGPCNATLAGVARFICTDAAGVDRRAVHEKMNREIGDFFDRALGPPP